MLLDRMRVCNSVDSGGIFQPGQGAENIPDNVIGNEVGDLFKSSFVPRITNGGGIKNNSPELGVVIL